MVAAALTIVFIGVMFVALLSWAAAEATAVTPIGVVVAASLVAALISAGVAAESVYRLPAPQAEPTPWVLPFLPAKAEAC